MKLYVSPTSPYARLACIMCLEARLPDLDIVIVDPWQNPPELARHNPALRVPTLVLGDGDAAQALTESLLIADYAARNAVDAGDLWFADETESRIGGLCLGIIDAAAAIMAGRMVTSGSLGDPAFDTSPVAGRRQAAIVRSLDSLEALLADAATPPAARPCLAAFLPAIVVDYLEMRFGDLYETPARPHLAQTVQTVSTRPAVQRTRPLFTQFTPLDA
jgi:glutathione S-transferase